MIASGSIDNTIRLWDVRSGETLQVLTGHTLGIQSVSFSPDGSKIVSSGGGDHTIRLWDIPKILTPLISISPNQVECPPEGEQFTVDVNISGGYDIRGYNISVNYDNDKIRYISHSTGNYLSDEVFCWTYSEYPRTFVL